jgi:hypothetical protein
MKLIRTKPKNNLDSFRRNLYIYHPHNSMYAFKLMHTKTEIPKLSHILVLLFRQCPLLFLEYLFLYYHRHNTFQTLPTICFHFQTFLQVTKYLLIIITCGNCKCHSFNHFFLFFCFYNWFQLIFLLIKIR